MIKKKKRWQKPMLIILERGKQEEAVLASCKTGSTNGPGTIDKCKDNAPRCMNSSRS